jgi:hypothetical protein
MKGKYVRKEPEPEFVTFKEPQESISELFKRLIRGQVADDVNAKSTVDRKKQKKLVDRMDEGGKK